jgi:hypothetical protein
MNMLLKEDQSHLLEGRLRVKAQYSRLDIPRPLSYGKLSINPLSEISAIESLRDTCFKMMARNGSTENSATIANVNRQDYDLIDRCKQSGLKVATSDFEILVE